MTLTLILTLSKGALVYSTHHSERAEKFRSYTQLIQQNTIYTYSLSRINSISDEQTCRMHQIMAFVYFIRCLSQIKS